jgi:hypothetical protein
MKDNHNIDLIIKHMVERYDSINFNMTVFQDKDIIIYLDDSTIEEEVEKNMGTFLTFHWRTVKIDKTKIVWKNYKTHYITDDAYTCYFVVNPNILELKPDALKLLLELN